MNTYTYFCACCKQTIPCHPTDPSLDKVFIVKIKDKKFEYEFLCDQCYFEEEK